MLRKGLFAIGLAASWWLSGAAQEPMVIMSERPMSHVVGTAFGPQPPSVWSELCEPLPCHSACPPRFWVSADYLLWSMKRSPVSVPLLTTTVVSNPDIFTNTGVLGQSDTLILLGNEDFQYGVFSGMRVGFGYHLRSDGSITLEGNGFLLEQRRVNQTFTTNSEGFPVLSLPFQRVNGTEGRFIYTFPTDFAGGVHFSLDAQAWGAELNIAFNDLNGAGACGLRIDGLAGFRYLGLQENLHYQGVSETIGNRFGTSFNGVDIPDVGAIVGHQDNFETSNHFYGGQIGVRASYDVGRFTLQSTAKLALGWTEQIIRVDGFSFLKQTPTSGIDMAPGGIYASPVTNMGRHTNDEFGFVPELSFQTYYQLNETVRVGAGYTFLYWNKVVRPGEQIDRVINTTPLPLSGNFGPFTGPARPVVPFDQSSFWLQGVNFSVELRY